VDPRFGRAVGSSRLRDCALVRAWLCGSFSCGTLDLSSRSLPRGRDLEHRLGHLVLVRSDGARGCVCCRAVLQSRARTPGSLDLCFEGMPQSPAGKLDSA